MQLCLPVVVDPGKLLRHLNMKCIMFEKRATTYPEATLRQSRPIKLMKQFNGRRTALLNSTINSWKTPLNLERYIFLTRHPRGDLVVKLRKENSFFTIHHAGSNGVLSLPVDSAIQFRARVAVIQNGNTDTTVKGARILLPVFVLDQNTR